MSESYGYYIVIPSFIFLDAQLTPTERLLYGLISGLSNERGYCFASNGYLAKNLRYESNGETKQVAVESVSRMISHLIECGYLVSNDMDGQRILIPVVQKTEIVVSKPDKKKESVSHPDAENVLNYLSECRIVRGYGKRPIKPTPNALKYISEILKTYTVEDCMAVINSKFQDKYFIANPQYLDQVTLFRKDNFEKYLTASQQIADVHLKVVTAGGLEYREKEDKKTINKVGKVF